MSYETKQSSQKLQNLGNTLKVFSILSHQGNTDLKHNKILSRPNLNSCHQNQEWQHVQMRMWGKEPVLLLFTECKWEHFEIQRLKRNTKIRKLEIKWSPDPALSLLDAVHDGIYVPMFNAGLATRQGNAISLAVNQLMMGGQWNCSAYSQ